MNSPDGSDQSHSGWKAAELSTLQEGLRLTFRERLLWLSDMLDFADRFCGAASGRKFDHAGNIVPVDLTSHSPIAPLLEKAVAEEPAPYSANPTPPQHCP